MNSTEPMANDSPSYEETLKEMQRLCVRSWEENEIPMDLTSDVNKTFNFRAPTPPRAGPHQTLTDKAEWMEWLTELMWMFPLPEADVEAYLKAKPEMDHQDRMEMAASIIYQHLIPPSE